jgi:Holliday junction DNA helicase RuvA
MIGYLSGNIIQIKPTQVLLDVNGVGYQINISISTFEKISDSKNVSLFIHTNVRQDAINLYGFFSQEEKEMFELLISISGIGPKLALSILSGISVDDLSDSISKGNLDRLISIPGVGRKTAERIVLELKSKISEFETVFSSKFDYSIRQQAIAALVTLGYNQKNSEKVVRDLLTENPSLSLEEIIKKSLTAFRS